MNLADATKWGIKELKRLEHKARVIRDRLARDPTTHLTEADLNELIEAQEGLKAILNLVRRQVLRKTK